MIKDFTSIDLSNLNLLPFKIYFTFLFVVGLGVGLYYYYHYLKLKKTMIAEKYKKVQQEITTTADLQKRLEAILFYQKSNDINELKIAIIEGDVLVEEILRLQGFQGDTLAGLLSEATLAAIPGVDKLWRFHRFRNVLVHDSTFVLELKKAQDTLKLLAEAFQIWKLT